MAAREPYDYLGVVSPDYNYTLDLSASSARVAEAGNFNQALRWGSGRSLLVRDYGAGPFFSLQLDPAFTRPEFIGTILDLYHDTAKAHGRMNSWKLKHPDGHTYVVVFDCDLPRRIRPAGFYLLSAIDLMVIGVTTDDVVVEDYLTIGGQVITIGGQELTLSGA
jgi:hypothetical protein